MVPRQGHRQLSGTAGPRWASYGAMPGIGHYCPIDVWVMNEMSNIDRDLQGACILPRATNRGPERFCASWYSGRRNRQSHRANRGLLCWFQVH